MPLSRIEIEQVEASRWVAEIEAGGKPGGPPFKRLNLAAQSFLDIMAAVFAVYFAQVPEDKPPEPVTETGQRQRGAR